MTPLSSPPDLKAKELVARLREQAIEHVLDAPAEAADLIEEWLEAFEAIVGPSDSGPYIDVYRFAGGGYAGLQAIAESALRGGFARNKSA